MSKSFIDVRNMTKEDWQKVDKLMKAYGWTIQEAIGAYMLAYPEKLKVVADVKDGEIVKTDITENGVKEYKGEEALEKMKEELEKEEDES